MAVIPFVHRGESVTAVQMNALYQAFENKMTQMLHGKSFLVGQRGKGGHSLGAIHPKLMGKCFFFTEGQTFFSNNAPEFIADGDGARNYDRDQFAMVAAGVVITSYDEDLKIANIEQVDGAEYDGLPQSEAVGFFEHSLEIWSVDYQGTSDAEPVPYYFREPMQGAYTQPPPEKFLRYGLAEIIIESDVFDGTGQAALSFAEADWWLEGDTQIGKYGCYRIHNLQAQECDVVFRNDPELAADLTVTLAAYECRTVRRNERGVYEATGWHYFFPYRAAGGGRWPGNDPRFFCFLPTKTNDGNTNITDTHVSADQPRATNSLAANNLTNAALLVDWILHFDDNPDGTGVNSSRRGYWAPALARDLDAEGAEPDLWPFYQKVIPDPANPGERLDLFGDPTNPATLLGDLIHHKGKIVIIRKSKTITDPLTGQPQLTRDEVFFRGWATIVEDFAAKLLTVETRTGVDQPFSSIGGTNVALVVDSADPDNDVELIPIGTNLFHNCYDGAGNLQGGSLAAPLCVPTLVELPAFINPSVWQYSDNATRPAARITGLGFMNDNAANVVQRPVLMGYPNQERDYQTMDGAGDLTTQTETAGDPSTGILDFGPESRSTTWYTLDGLHNIHQVTVADLLTLTPWGEAAHHPDQSNEYVTYDQAELKLTWQGWMIKFRQTFHGLGVQGNESDQNGGAYTRPYRRLYFRDLGWPQLIGADPSLISTNTGSSRLLWFSPRKGRYVTTVDCGYEEAGVSGADFTVGPLGVAETEIRQLYGPMQLPGDGFQGDLWLKNPNSRFWRPRFVDNFLLFLEQGQTDVGYWAIRGYLKDGPKDTADDPATTSERLPYLPLLAESYNALAALVNSCTRALPLNALSLWWKFQDPDEAPGTMKAYYLPGPGDGANVGTNYPVPLEEYCEVGADTDFEELCGHVGLSVRDDSDLPGIGPSVHGAPDPSSLEVSKFSLLTVTTTLTPSSYSVNPDSDPGNPYGYLWTGDVTIARTVTDGTDAYYAALTGPALEAVKGIAVWRSDSGFDMIDLKVIYADYAWVSFADVLAAFGGYGIPVIAAQMVIPLRLNLLTSPRTFSAPFVRSSSTDSVSIQCEAGAVTPSSVTIGPTLTSPHGPPGLMLRSGYWFGPAPTVQDYEDPDEAPEPAQWKTIRDCESEDKVLSGLPTWWLGGNTPLHNYPPGTGDRDAWARLEMLSAGVQAGYSAPNITLGFQIVEDTFGDPDFPGTNPAAWPDGWLYQCMTWPSTFLDDITQTQWRMMLCKNVGAEVVLVHDQYWTAQPDITTAAEFMANYHADTEPVFNDASGYLGTVTIPQNEYRTIRPVAVAGDQPFYGPMIFRETNAYVTLT